MLLTFGVKYGFQNPVAAFMVCLSHRRERLARLTTRSILSLPLVRRSVEQLVVDRDGELPVELRGLRRGHMLAGEMSAPSLLRKDRFLCRQGDSLRRALLSRLLARLLRILVGTMLTSYYLLEVP